MASATFAPGSLRTTFAVTKQTLAAWGLGHLAATVLPCGSLGAGALAAVVEVVLAEQDRLHTPAHPTRESNVSTICASSPVA